MFCQVVTPHKPLATVRANKAFLPCMSPQVPLELIRPGETLATEQPITHKRTLSRVPPEVRFEVRSFAINFPAAWYVTDVLFLLARLVVRSRGLAVGTPAPPTSPSSGERRLGVQQSRDLSLVLCKVRMSQYQASLQLKTMVTKRWRVADVIALLKAPPRNILSGVRGQLSLLLVHKARGSRNETWHRRRNGSWGCVSNSGDVRGWAC